MNRFIFRVLVGLAATCSFTLSHAQSPSASASPVFVEALSEKLTLPSSPDGVLVMAPCGDCQPASFHATAATLYKVGGQPVTLGELRKAVLGRNGIIVTVSYDPKTGEVRSVSAAGITSPAPSAKR